MKRARQEHDAFADTLRDRGVEVLYLADLLAETLADDVARKWVLEHGRSPSTSSGRCWPRTSATISLTLDADELARVLIGGLRRELTVPGGRGLRVGDAGAERLRARAAAEPPVHARHVVLDLRRRLDEPDGQAGPPPGDRPPRSDLRLPPDVRRRGVRNAGTAASTSSGAAPRSKAATSS